MDSGGGASTKALESANKSDFTVAFAMLSQDGQAGNGIDPGSIVNHRVHGSHG